MAEVVSGELRKKINQLLQSLQLLSTRLCTEHRTVFSVCGNILLSMSFFFALLQILAWFLQEICCWLYHSSDTNQTEPEFICTTGHVYIMIVFKEFQQRRSKAALSVTGRGSNISDLPQESKYKQCAYSALTRVVLPLLSDAYDTAKMLCEKYYLAAPELKIEEFNSERFLAFSAIIHLCMRLTVSPC